MDTKKDEILRLVLSNVKLIDKFGYNPNDYRFLSDALYAEDPIVVAVATIIDGVGQDNNDEIYKKVFNYLNENML